MFPSAMELQIQSKTLSHELFRKVLSISHEPIHKVSCQSLICAIKEAEGWCGVVYGHFEGSGCDDTNVRWNRNDNAMIKS